MPATNAWRRRFPLRTALLCHRCCRAPGQLEFVLASLQERQGGWSAEHRQFAGTITCRRGEWYIRLKHDLLDRGLWFRGERQALVSQHPIQLGTPYMRAALSCLRRLTTGSNCTGSISADVVGAGAPGVEQGKPQEFDFCFGVPLKAGDKPPDFAVHVA